MRRIRSSVAVVAFAGVLASCGAPVSSRTAGPASAGAADGGESIPERHAQRLLDPDAGLMNACGINGCPQTCHGSPTCTMPDGCPGTRECLDGVWSACEWSGTGAIACTHNGVSGSRTCGVSGASATCTASCSACGLGGTQTWTEASSTSWSPCDIGANRCNTPACGSSPPGGYSCESGALICRFKYSWSTLPQVSCTTDHGVAGTAVCANNGDGLCRGAEVCNGFDDNLDGLVDNEPGTWSGQACVTANLCGGTYVCRSGALACQPLGGTTNAPACTSTLGYPGHINCSADGRQLGCRPDAPNLQLDICNGVDDDADGVIDNFPGSSVPYSVYFTSQWGSCSGKQLCTAAGPSPWVYTGSQACKNRCGDSVQQTCDPTTGDLMACPERIEICNGEDDNCDGLIDEGDVCRQQRACKQ